MKTTYVCNNGTVIEIGKRYTFSNWYKAAYIEVYAIGKRNVFGSDNKGNDIFCSLSNDWRLYEEAAVKPAIEEETWTKTMDLRYSERELIGVASMSLFTLRNLETKFLEQKHISNLGNEKWVTV